MQHHSHHQLQSSTFSDWLPLLIVAALALVYLYTLVKLKYREIRWSAWRTMSFMCGIALVGIALNPSLMQWAHTDLRGHMVQHLLIGMYAPVFLVLGTPVTLALKAFPVKVARGVTAALKSKFFYGLSHPGTAFILNIGGMYVLYLTPLYNQSLINPYLHYIVHLHFLLAGYLFTWAIIGPDPAPKRPGLRIRVLVLFISIASHAFLSKFMYAYLYPLHSPHSDEQIREAAKLMYYWGDLSELILTILLFAIWYRKRGRAKYDLAPLVP